MKPFKTLDEQIQQLKDRGLVISDDDKVKQYLLTQNYYNIINGYGCFFPKNGENYIAGTSFDEIAKLYIFEKDIKRSLLQGILDMEAHLKSIFAYRFAEEYPSSPYAYLDVNCYDSSNILNSINTISRLSKKISDNRNPKNGRYNSISHYLKKHNGVPIWVLVNYIEFGELRFMLQNSSTKLQNAVAKDFYSFITSHLNCTVPFTPEVMMSFISNIHNIRNICAHNNRLIGHICDRDSKYWAPLHDKHNISKTSDRNTPYSVFISLQCFLSNAEYGAVHNTVRKRLKHLDGNLKTISTDNILDKLGFPIGWHKNVSKISY